MRIDLQKLLYFNGEHSVHKFPGVFLCKRKSLLPHLKTPNEIIRGINQQFTNCLCNTISLKSDPHTPESVTQGSRFELPELDATLGPCAFAKEAIRKLLATGYIFTDSQMELYSSVESSREYTRRNLPLFWILKEGESRKTCDKSIRERYWAEEFTSGQYRFLAFSQWYDDSKKVPQKKIS